MGTRLSTAEKHDIALGAALLYTRNADSVMQTEADYDYPTFNHVALDEKYANELVWIVAVQKLGEKRADNLSFKQTTTLTKYALAEFRMLRSIDYCNERGFTRVHGGAR